MSPGSPITVMKDGKIFDFLSQTTPTGGQELSYLRNIFKNVGFHL